MAVLHSFRSDDRGGPMSRPSFGFRPIVVGLALLLAGPGCSHQADKPDEPAPQSLADLESALRGVLERTNTPGLGVALVHRGEAPWVAALGKADRAADLDVTPSTRFRAGSISKT